MPSVSFRFTDEEIKILEFGVEKSYFESKKSFIMDLVREFVHGSVFDVMGAFPEDMRLSDEQLSAFIDLQEFKELEKWRMFVKDIEQWNMILKQSRFADLEDFEQQRKVAYEKAGLKYERMVMDHE